MRKKYLNKKGQGALLLVTVLCGVGFILLTSSLDVFVRDYNYKAKDFNQVLLDEVTSSSFALMESALERRLWEPPPDENCFKSNSFEVSGTLPEGMTWKVTAVFNSQTRNFELTAQGNHRALTSQFKKKIKIMDASDYLLLSTNPTKEIYLDRLYSLNSPSALIARDRRIYTRGPLVMRGVLNRAGDSPYTSYNTWSGSPASFPAEWGTILQGDRMQFGGGINYQYTILPTPNGPRPDNLISMLAPYSFDWGESAHKVFSSAGAGSSVFTNDYNLATQLRSQVIAGDSGPLTKSALQRYVYPVALFGGSPPLLSWNATDTGAYFNDLDRYSIFYYTYGGANGYGVRINTTCLTRASDYNTKYCSNSEHFPKGFEQWRRDAGLEGYLFTADTTEVPSPVLSWDNFQALEEDARQCGAVVDTPVNPYVDCPIWEDNFLRSYAATGSTSACQRTSSIDLDTLALNNFNASAIVSAANEDRLLRRVIYLKVPAEIKQTNDRGLMLSRLPDNTARKKASFWIVSEDIVTLKGYQKDTTSPLDTQPAKLREVVFNDDVSGAATSALKTPLNFTLLTPEKPHLISPFYVPMTPSHLQTIWPASGGRIRPIRSNFTDADRQEEDGFKYGYRSYRVNNVSLISNAAASISNPFFLRGLWGAPDSSAEQFISNQCMVSMAGVPMIKYPTDERLAYVAQIPSYHSAANSPIPPLHSRYYNGLNRFPYKYVPEVFYVQSTAMGSNIDQSEVSLTGISISTTFSNITPSGKRDISKPLYTPVDARPRYDNVFSLEHKHFAWEEDNLYKNRPINTPCTLENMEYRAALPGDPYDEGASNPAVNSGRHVYTQISPDESYRNIGAIVGVDQLVIETKAGN